MALRIRLLPIADADGATNMARDEVLLESALQGIASLRFYTWTEATLSLGYFQPSAVRDGPRYESLPWVRRSTGGGAILHHHELTYSFALPAEVARASGESWICHFHHLLQEVLARSGVDSQLVKCGEERKLGEVLCFLDQTPGDLLIAGCKLAGSAQRKPRGALLQHGSILLKASPFAPELRGINDLAGRELFDPQSLAAALADSIAGELGGAIEPGHWTEEELARCEVIRREKYANPEWNGKR